jgi:DedD protein
MDERLKQRLTGAIVLIALGVIFIPMVLDGPDEAAHKVKVELPPKPEYAFQSRVVPLPPKAPPAAVSSTPPTPAPADRPVQAAPAPDTSAATPPNPVVALPSAVDKPAAVPAPVPATAQSTSPPASPTGVSPPKAAPVAWVVQVGSFGSETNANKLRAELRKAGFAAFVESEGEGTQKAFKVRVGPETERASADALKSRLQGERKLTAHVRPYP